MFRFQLTRPQKTYSLFDGYIMLYTETVRLTGDQGVAGSTPAGSETFFSWRFDHEIFSTIILSLPLIQEGQLSASGERMCTIMVNRLED